MQLGCGQLPYGLELLLTSMKQGESCSAHIPRRYLVFVEGAYRGRAPKNASAKRTLPRVL